jgi:hypothetical protein
MKPKTYLVLERAVDDGIACGYRRAHKHDDNPSEDHIVSEIAESVMNEIFNWFDINDEERLELGNLKDQIHCAMDVADRLKEERDEAREVLEAISLHLSVGMGDESTTAAQYHERILEGIKMLTDPLIEKWQAVGKERDEARRERDEALRYSLLAKKMESERDEARRERDRLLADVHHPQLCDETIAKLKLEIERHKGLLVRLYNDLHVTHDGSALRDLKEMFREENIN